MAEKLLKETKDTEVKKRKINSDIEKDDIYKIDFDIQDNDDFTSAIPKKGKLTLEEQVENTGKMDEEKHVNQTRLERGLTNKTAKNEKGAKTKNVVNAKNEVIRTIEDDDDEIDDILGNVNRWLTADDEGDENSSTAKLMKDINETKTKAKRKRLAKIEEGIKSSKKTKTKKIAKIADGDIEENPYNMLNDIEKIYGQENVKNIKNAKTNSQSIKNEESIKSTKNSKIEEKDIVSNIEESKQSEITMHAGNNLTEIVLKKNKYRIELQKDEYNIYTEANETSYIIVRDEGLRIISTKNGEDGKNAVKKRGRKSAKDKEKQEDIFVWIEKQGEVYEITTNQDFKINYVIDNLERKNNRVNFKLTNLTEIIAEEDGLIFEINEEKVIENNLEDNFTLVISEEDGKVYLPYSKEEVKQEIIQNKGVKISEIIENKYILPLDKYKNSMRARFREGYNLMYRKEGKSKKKAIMLGIELMFETNLHPAIISACKNLEELDIYLDCLEDNELEKFSCFKIIYKSLPTIRKKARYQEL